MSNNNDEPDKPFNDAIDHQPKIEGSPAYKGGRLP
ncbi:hypothetical protein SAMN05216179_3508 [Gracilibacillus kekensis]|uniref:Uncharacterized protein n=1 Tax=Gracilibacillus kekensis TaxID=1027249 RepID=A0A1M7QSD1_9BACI|nr:hypothetical protein SAMN05216179_3508 [Gracilibacillus kekensis]